MFRHLPSAALLAGLLCAACTAGPQQDACGAPGVIDTVADELARAGIPGTLDARTPGQVGVADSTTTSCAVWLLQSDVNTNLPPDRQVRRRVTVQNFQVRRLAHSLVVELIGPPVPQEGPDGPYRGGGIRP